ncbi:TetR/AcrR family transcriptional regulator [Candidatus Pantoea deserta]|uniref:TetR/AcrR family transcriptional regulator n=2 Tax=Candidatus Pantoea deserta TaxID=1869313 RepID=A0A3N4NA18_9GAMM|nr:TetR/AcrR family transcriptional regulator [Pantoea deserta]
MMSNMGRPRTFDRDKAIENAMYLFWQYGYESTSLSQLKAGIGNGISAPSFYAAFGSKEALFRECVQRYLSTFGKVTAFLWDNSLPPREALEKTLRNSAQMQCEDGHPSGCMVGLGALSATSAEHAAAAEPLTRSRIRTREGIAATIQRAVDSGELGKEVDVMALSTSFSTFLFGLSIQARDGATTEELNAAVSQIMRLWDASKA